MIRASCLPLSAGCCDWSGPRVDIEMPPPRTIATASWHGDLAFGNAATAPFAAGLRLSAAQPQPGFDLRGARSCPDRARRLFCAITSARDASRTFGRDYAGRQNDPVHFRYAAQCTEGGDHAFVRTH